MKKIKQYKNARHFATESLGLSEYEAWLISFKNKLIKLVIETRKKNNITQKELAQLLGTTQSVVSRLESGNSRHITIDYLLKIISILGISPNRMIKIAA